MAGDQERVEAVTTLEHLADRVAGGGELRQEDAALVWASHDLITIGMMADDVRRRLHGSKTTFLRVLELHVDAVPSSLPTGAAAGEIRLIGRPVSTDAACATVERARGLAGEVPLTGFSLTDLAHLDSSPGDPYRRLRSAGLDGVAEAVAEDLMSDWVRAARDAGLHVQRMTVRMPPADPLVLFEDVRRMQATAGGFRAFAPLPRTIPVAPTTGYDDVKLVALARLLLRDVPSIQVDWPLYGPKLAQVALTVGADDVDGVAAVETGALGTRRSALEEIKGNIRAAGLEPVERNGRFEVRAG